MKPGSHSPFSALGGRRQFIRASMAAALASRATAQQPADSHTTLRAGDLTAVVGNNAAHEQHRAGYNGLWSLQHAKGTRSLFATPIAGLNLEHIVTGEHLEDSKTFFEPRQAPMTLTRISDSGAELHQPPTPTFHVESWTRFKLSAPHYLDMDFRCRAHRDVFPRGYLSLFWASYMNAPADKSLYFLGGLDPQKEMWTQFCTQWHNDQSTVWHRDDTFEMTFPEGGRDTLFKSLSRFRFDLPFFYGHFDDLVWIVMFDRSKGIRFTHSPSGGGANAELKTTNPAWDFQFLIQKPEVMKDYGFKVRTVLRPRCSREEILAEFARWNEGNHSK
ncbi:MAG: hypothetical protein HS117_21410 [Verrucomicrobiaceae bacterium]|nr:hypothetical protein [Verrucomicrobiaceae bacterium]